MVSNDEIKKRWPVILSVSHRLLDELGPKFTNTPGGHIQTDIAATGSLAGLMLLQETVPDSELAKLAQSAAGPGNVILSEVHEGQQDILRFMEGVAMGSGLDPRGGWGDRIPPKHKPLMECCELTRRLAPPFYAACQSGQLECGYYKFAAALTGLRLVDAGQHMAVLDPNIGKALLFYYVVAGSKTIPYAEALWGTQGAKVDNQSRIARALSALLQRDNEDAFVIFEEKESGKYVQFAGSAHENLFLDLPIQTLTKTEVERAKVLFQELGIQGPQEYPTYTDKSLETMAGMQISFQVNFGQNVQQAVQFTQAIFDRVYEFPQDFQLVIEEN
jgi:hypothetical protein